MKKLFLLTFALMASVALMANDKANDSEPLSGEQNLVPVNIVLQATSEVYFQSPTYNMSKVTYESGSGRVSVNIPWGTTTINVVPGSSINLKLLVHSAPIERDEWMYVTIQNAHANNPPCDQHVIDNNFSATASSGLTITGTFHVINQSEVDSKCW